MDEIAIIEINEESKNYADQGKKDHLRTPSGDLPQKTKLENKELQKQINK